MDEVPGVFEQLIGEEMSAVTFVRDYLQLQFDPPPTVNVMSRVTVHTGGACASSGEESFANLLVAQIGKRVRDLRYSRDAYLEIQFADDSKIVISLESDDYVGAESVIIFGRNHEWNVLQYGEGA